MNSEILRTMSDYLQLFSHEKGVFAQCRAAVIQGNLDWRAPQLRAQIALIDAYADEALAPLISGALNAVVDLAEYVAGSATDRSLTRAGAAIARTTAWVDDPTTAAAWLTKTGMDTDGSMAHVVAQGVGPATILALWAAALRGELDSDRSQASVSVPAVFANNDGGLVGSINLRLITDGPKGLFPDPDSMALAVVDDAFRQGIRRAWTARPVTNGTVLWSVNAGDTDAFIGDSATAAFTLALDELTKRSRRLGRFRAMRANAQYVVSANVDDEGQLSGVSELPEKFRALKAGDKHAVLAAVDREKAAGLAISSGVTTHYAKTVDEAIAITRRWNPAFVTAATAALACILVLTSGGWLAARQVAAADLRTQNGRLMSKVGDLQALADRAGSGTVPDRQVQALLLLAANSLAKQAGQPDVADAIVNRAVQTQPGVLQSMDADLGFIEGIHLAAGKIIVDSGTGKLAAIDPRTNDIVGVYTVAPGRETLDQPQLVAFGKHPHASLFAAVYQPISRANGISPAARLKIFSVGSTLSLVGSTPGFTNDPVEAVAYSPGGDRLVAVTESVATFWDTTEATPRVVGDCLLPLQPNGVTHRALLSDPKTSLPLLINSDTSVVSLASWSIAASGQPCKAKTVVKPWVANVMAPAFHAPTVTAGVNSDKRVVVVATSADGRVHVRDTTTGTVSTLAIQEPVTGIGEPNDQIAVQTGTAGKTSVGFWDIGDVSKPTQIVAYAKHALPAVYVGVCNVAVTLSGKIVDMLSDRAMIYPAGFADLAERRRSNAVAAGERAFAAAYTGGIGVYRLSDAKQGTLITTPEKYELSAGDNRIGATFSISHDGRYVAAIMGPGSQTFADRRVFVWDAENGVQMPIPEQVQASDNRYHHPIDVRFLPGGNDLLVNYQDGTLYRLSSDNGVWSLRTVRSGTTDLSVFGMELGPGGIYVIEKPRLNEGRQRVLRMSNDGAVVRSWDITAINSRSPQVVPLSDTGALLIDTGGEAYRLSAAGTVGSPVRLRADAILQAAQIPGTQKVLIATQGLAKIYDLSHDLTELSDSQFGAAFAFGITPDGRYAIESDVLNGTVTLAALRPEDKIESLCVLAGREMSRQEWLAYVGDIARYRKLCTATQASLTDYYNAVRQGSHTPPPAFVRTPTPDDVAAYGSACANALESGMVTSGPFAWKPAPADEPICSEGKIRWVIPDCGGVRIAGGRVGKEPVLVVTGPYQSGSPDDPHKTIFGMDLLLTNAQAASEAGELASATITASGVQFISRQGNVLIRENYGPDVHGYWDVVSFAPAGKAG